MDVRRNSVSSLMIFFGLYICYDLFMEPVKYWSNNTIGHSQCSRGLSASIHGFLRALFTAYMDHIIHWPFKDLITTNRLLPAAGQSKAIARGYDCAEYLVHGVTIWFFGHLVWPKIIKLIMSEVSPLCLISMFKEDILIVVILIGVLRYLLSKLSFWEKLPSWYDWWSQETRIENNDQQLPKLPNATDQDSPLSPPHVKRFPVRCNRIYNCSVNNSIANSRQNTCIPSNINHGSLFAPKSDVRALKAIPEPNMDIEDFTKFIRGYGNSQHSTSKKRKATHELYRGQASRLVANTSKSGLFRRDKVPNKRAKRVPTLEDMISGVGIRPGYTRSGIQYALY